MSGLNKSQLKFKDFRKAILITDRIADVIRHLRADNELTKRSENIITA